LQKDFPIYISEVLGLKNEAEAGDNSALEDVMQLVLDLRADARENKNWGVSDKIRDALAEAKIVVKDGKDGSTWTMN